MDFEKEIEKATLYQLRTYGCDMSVILRNARAMHLVGVKPEKIYAYCKTGIIVLKTQGNTLNLDWQEEKKQLEYFSAINEFNAISKGH